VAFFGLLVQSAHHVLDGDAVLRTRALHLGEVHAELLGFLLRGVRGFRLLSAPRPLLCRLLTLLGYLLALLGSLSCRVLRLSGHLTRGILRLLRGLSRLIGHLPGRVLGLTRDLSGLIRGLPRHLLGLVGHLPGRVLHALGYLPHLVGDPAERTAALLAAALLATGQTAGEAPNRVLNLARGLPRLIGHLASRVLGLTRDLSGLIRGLPRHLLGLVGHLPGRVLRPLREIAHGLLELFGGLVHRVLYALVLGRTIHRALDLFIGVDHLIYLGLGITVGNLLRVLLELLAVVLDLGLDPAHRLPEEVLGLFQVLLVLRLLLKIRSLICHFVSLLFVDFRLRWAMGLTRINPTDFSDLLSRD
jgi:hypothetical protein